MMSSLRILFLLFMVGCIHLAHVDGAFRATPQQAAGLVTIEVTCLTDTFGTTGGVIDTQNKAASGVFLDDRHVLTAAHVSWCSPAATTHITVVLSDGRQFMMVIAKENLVTDLANLEKLSVDNFNMALPPPVIGPPPAVGDTVCTAVAVPKKEWHCGQVLSRGDVNSLGDVLTSAATAAGNSGGAVYDDKGRLVGIHHGHTDCDGVPCAAFTSLYGRAGFQPK